LGYNQFGLDVMAAPARHGADYSNITVLALQLYTDYNYSFELAAVLLLIKYWLRRRTLKLKIARLSLHYARKSLPMNWQ
jgi:hypothetical protein